MDGATFVLLSFEGPDGYAHAGGLGSRVSEMAHTLARMGLETHLVFVGDPYSPGHEVCEGGNLILHRWCQWISLYHPLGVYDGEEGKVRDWTRSLPGWLESEILAPKVAAGEAVVVIAEEWQTAASVSVLGDVVRRRRWQDYVHLLWNANNTYSLDRIDWASLKRAATVTTVSRYMKHAMARWGVDAHVVPNGIAEDWLEPPHYHDVDVLADMLSERVVLAKVARWGPDKRWEMAVDATAGLKRAGTPVLLLARGGIGSYRFDVLGRAHHQGLSVASVFWEGPSAEELADAIRPALVADVVHLQGWLSQEQRKVLFRAVDGVLANSEVEPFGLVGLETMAVGGVAFVGCTGEDYATHGYDAIAIQTAEPNEVVHQVRLLGNYGSLEQGIRESARNTAARHTWPQVLRRSLFSTLRGLGVDAFAEPGPAVVQQAPAPLPLVLAGSPGELAAAVR